ncbi:ABC transporter ATP-binding protein [Halorussus halobius]|uniref:ABC transporter ATP-binding protein n=1 Tax=Halorussus halobius TaxID=1710537 RepID=UPI00143D95B7|nr:ABC transporter ATP-binding protein [Halorussus halobius]
MLATLTDTGEPEFEYAVEVTDLHQQFDGVEVLTGVTVRSRRGEVCGLLGPNGAGKTTTLKTLVGALRPVSGRVRLLGRRPARDPTVRAAVGVVFEHETLNPRWTVGDNLRHTCAVYEVSPDRIDEALRTVTLSPDERDTPFGDLSNGMQRKASIANAIVHDPEVLVLDEPTNGLDPDAQQTVVEVLSRLRETGRTILFSSHDLGKVSTLCDRVSIIDGGATVTETAVGDSERDLEALYFDATGGRT